MNIEEINNEIRGMGYTPFVPKTERPNFYRLDDGAIIRIYPILNALYLNPSQMESMQMNIQSNVSTFVPKRLRSDPSNRSYTQEELQTNIDVYDMEFTILDENFNTYDVDSKWILSVKTALSQVSKTKLFSNLGEPIYLVSTTLIPKVKPRNVK